MHFKRHLLLVTLVALALGAPAAAFAQTSADYEEAWEHIQKLAGTWTRLANDKNGGDATITYHVTSGGSVVFEEFVGDTPEGVRDMATAYHMDVDALVATHYCGAGNQPRMRASSWDPHKKVVRFDFWDVTHLGDPDDYYTTNIELRFKDDDHVELLFRGTEKGKQGEWQTHQLRRESRRPHKRETDEP